MITLTKQASRLQKCRIVFGNPCKIDCINQKITISGLNYITIVMSKTKLSFDLLTFILKNQQLQEIILSTMKALETKASFRLDEKKYNLLILRLSPLIRCRPFPSKFFRLCQT
jgi:hypothetical protein